MNQAELTRADLIQPDETKCDPKQDWSSPRNRKFFILHFSKQTKIAVKIFKETQKNITNKQVNHKTTIDLDKTNNLISIDEFNTYRSSCIRKSVLDSNFFHIKVFFLNFCSSFLLLPLLLAVFVLLASINSHLNLKKVLQ